MFSQLTKIDVLWLANCERKRAPARDLLGVEPEASTGD
jgi:hypothetical protein